MRAMLMILMLGGCGEATPGGPADMSGSCAPEDADTPADLSTPPDAEAPPDFASCYSLACPRFATCGDYVNGNGEVEYVTCCALGGPVHCHDALGLGESCERSVCGMGETCANGFPNGGATALVMVCCSSPASAPTVRCTAAP